MIDLNATVYGNSGGEYMDVSGNIIYSWWCPRCQCEHYSTHCPKDLIMEEEYNGYQSSYYEVCPHCGQLIRKED